MKCFSFQGCPVVNMPPELPPLAPAFRGLARVISTFPVLKVVEVVLIRAKNKDEQFLTSQMVKQACFLIIQGKKMHMKLKLFFRVLFQVVKMIC